MFEWRLNIIILSFALLCAGVVVYSQYVSVDDEFALVGEQKKVDRDQESYFKAIDYHLIKEGKKQLSLLSDELILNSVTKRTSFVFPHGLFYTKSQDEVSFSSQNGLYRSEDNTFLMGGEVEIETEKSKMTSDTASYALDRDFFVSQGAVTTETQELKNGDRVVINAQKVLAWPKSKKSEYTGEVKGRVKRKRPYEPEVFFESDNIYLDLFANTIRLEGQVLVKRLEVTANSRRGEIYLENGNKRLKYYSLFDDVRLVEKIKTSENVLIERKAFGEKLEGITSEDKLILTGSPKVFQEDDVVKGNKIVLRENNEVIEVEDASSNFTIKKKAP